MKIQCYKLSKNGFFEYNSTLEFYRLVVKVFERSVSTVVVQRF